MRVALVCPYAWDRFGGVQSHVRALARTLAERGHEVRVLAPSARPEARAPAGVTIVGRSVRVPANGSVAPLAFGPVTAVEVRRALKEARPEVVHLHEPLIPSLSLLALLNSAVPALGTFHAAADSSLAYRASRPVLEPAVRRLRVRSAVSDAARALVARYFPGDYALTPNGVDVQRFASAEPLDLGSGKSVLFLGRLERRKGLEVLIEAMTGLRDLDARLVVCGSGPEEGPARRLAERLGVAVDFRGPTREDLLASAYRAADVYCAPGLGAESFGIVLLEAMAAGTPVVCSDLPAFRSVARGAAALVAPGDPKALAGALRRVLTDEQEARRMATAGSGVVAAFDWRRLVTDVEGLYERAVSVGAASA